MSFDAQRLYELLPAIYRIRDAEAGEPMPLRALMELLAEQVGIIEESLEQGYDDLFIETCAPWVVPYIGDLIGYRPLNPDAPQIGSARAEVAHTIGFRRRKGTAAMLEQLARDVTGWNARVVEYFSLLGTTQYMNHIRPRHAYAPDLRRWEPLERLNTAFETSAHTVDVRHIESGDGRYNIPNVGLFLWRLGAYSLTDSPAARVDDQRWMFSPLGNNTQLFTRPETEAEITHLAEPLNVPEPISRRVLDAYLSRYFGKGKSLFVSGFDVEQVVVCDLSDADATGTIWAHTPSAGKVAVDPVLGRLAFAEAQTEAPLVSFHYGFSADMSGGEYERGATFDRRLQPVQSVPPAAPSATPLQDALTTLTDGGALQITDSGRYEETLVIAVNAGKRLEVRAANEHRPTLVLGGELTISGEDDAEVTLNGLLICGDSLRVPPAPANGLRKLRLVHCTLVPGISLSVEGEPQQPTQASLIIESENVTVEIESCILGGIRAVEGAEVFITNSIVDATGAAEVAYSAPDAKGAGGTLHIENSTIIGHVHALKMGYASNVIFLSEAEAGDPEWTAPVRAARKQDGCVRFSYVPPGSIVPRRYKCQPEREADALRVRPRFTALRYGTPGYGQLSRRCAPEIRRGADDEAEMGAFHDLYQPQREANLRVRLDEYLRFGLEAGIFYAT